MWSRVWLLLGRAREMPNPGDYQVEDVGPESFIMVRQDDGSIRAFYNVCQHRGSRLIFNAAGLTRANPPIIAENAEVLAKSAPDPLPQALILTAIVISFGILAFALVLMRRAYDITGTDDLGEMRGTDQ